LLLQNEEQDLNEALNQKVKHLKQNKIYKNVYDNKKLVYIIKLQTFENESYIIKIGKSDQLKNRITALSSYYGCTQDKPIIIMNIFQCENNYNFEQFLHNNSYIKSLKYNELINNTNKSSEAYLIKSESIYEKIIRIINDNISYYQHQNLEELKELNKTKELQIKENEYKLMLENPELFNKMLDIKKMELEYNNKININEEILPLQEVINENKQLPVVQKIKIRDCGPLVQIYDKDNITKLLYVYNGITDATRKIENVSFTGIKKASENKDIYKGYRWFLVNRNDPNPNEVKDIGESNIPQQKNEDLIAILDIKFTKIEKVFLTQNDASKYINQTPSAVCKSINHKTPLSNKNIMLWTLVDENLKKKYLENNKLPEKQKN